ncbi:acyltransferase domain-containing protein [Paenarthrobacter sp. PH39-S1]|uniref:acyltransferase domain-containing protein n=1 Tax=Paenarthrobacter sp. PH39-S1 TaxID=3046204 RepID=UPI0024BA06BE|nr:acyltransferase domain-containing protein [Paenarthrobacter sp. PH39-S1]MDJ0357046.1 acyltransferase domain-containing protein [Paenarthrobacter sp. PH39-S1]
MTSPPSLTTDQILSYLAVEPADRRDCVALLQGSPGPGAVVVLAALNERLGTASGEPPRLEVAETDWIEGFLRFTPELVQWHAELGIPDGVTRATLADVGRNLDINRRVHGRFGLDTFRWLTHHYAGSIFQLGRLQYLMHQGQDSPPEAAAGTGGIPGAAAGEWLLGIHIPESGGLAPLAVQASLEQARPFFARYFPERPVRIADCASWLLDPYIPTHLDADSNIVRFARRFTPYCRPIDTPTDAVYFTFRTRNMTDLAGLPRRTALQRMVLERIDDGGCWQLAYGYLPLP